MTGKQAVVDYGPYPLGPALLLEDGTRIPGTIEVERFSSSAPGDVVLIQATFTPDDPTAAHAALGGARHLDITTKEES